MADGPGDEVPTGMADSDGKAEGEAEPAGPAEGDAVGGSYVQAGPLPCVQAANTAAMVTSVTICNVLIRAWRDLIGAFWPHARRKKCAFCVTERHTALNVPLRVVTATAQQGKYIPPQRITCQAVLRRWADRRRAPTGLDCLGRQSR